MQATWKMAGSECPDWALRTAITLLGAVALAYLAGHFVATALHNQVRLHEPIQIALTMTVGLVFLEAGGAL